MTAPKKGAKGGTAPPANGRRGLTSSPRRAVMMMTEAALEWDE